MMDPQEIDKRLRDLYDENSEPVDMTTFSAGLYERVSTIRVHGKRVPGLPQPLAAQAGERAGDYQLGRAPKASAPRRTSGLRIAVFASVAVVLVASVTVGSLMAVRNLAQPDFVLAITDENVVPTGAQSGHWEHLPLSSEGQAVNVLAMDPSNPSVLYAGTYEGLFKSSDGAESWSRLPTPVGGLVGNIPISIDPASPSTIYSFFYFETDAVRPLRLLRSDDGGVTWVTPSATGLPKFGAYGPFDIWFDTTSTPSTAYMAGPIGDEVVGSTDRGETWTVLSPEKAAQAKSKRRWPAGVEGTVSDGDTGSVLQVLAGPIDPNDSSIRYVGTDRGVYKSTDGGKSWKKASAGLTSSVVLSLVADPSSPSILYATTTVGIFKSGDAGTHWSMILPGPGSVVLAPSSPSTLYAWTPAGLFRTDDGGKNWTPLAGTGLVSTVSAPDGGFQGRLVLVALDNPDTVFADSGDWRGLLRSTDGGRTWSATDGRAPGAPLVADPQNPSTLYAGGTLSDQVTKSTDAGATWTVVSPLDWSGDRVVDIAVDPHAPSDVYVGLVRDTDFILARSLDGGATWHKVKLEGAAKYMSRLLFDPRSTGTMYAIADLWSASPTLYRTTDGGSTWTDITGGLTEPLGYWRNLDLVIDPASREGLYAVTSNGAFKWVAGVN